eukprot:scaffold7595_cov267-Pinguiococcus_pyrenoidosus.AAC.19
MSKISPKSSRSVLKASLESALGDGTFRCVYTSGCRVSVERSSAWPGASAPSPEQSTTCCATWQSRPSWKAALFR